MKRRFDAVIAESVDLFRQGDLLAACAKLEGIGLELASPAEAGPNVALGRVAYWKARCARRQERPDEAIRQIYSGLAPALSSGDGQTECLLRAELVHVLSSPGENDDALLEADVAWRRAGIHGDPASLAVAQEALASVYWMTEQWTLGLKAYEKAFELAQSCAWQRTHPARQGRVGRT